MERKKGLILFISSAMIALWACAEGDIVEANDKDELVQKVVSEKDNYEFVEPFMKYCEKKKDCEAEYVRSSSSVEDESSSSEESATSGSSKSSSSSKGGNSSKSSSSGKSSSSANGGNSAANSSDSQMTSSQSSVSIVSGKCVLDKPDVVHVGDEIVWRYAPDKGSIESADFVWEMSNEVEKSVVAGELSGTGTPKIKVVFKKAGKKYGPFLRFGNGSFECEDFVVSDEEPESSASIPSSSSAPKSSSSSQPKSSSSEVEGHCGVSKNVVTVGEKVDLYAAGPDGEVLEGFYNWHIYDAELVDGELSSKNGSTKITVTYSTTGTKEPMISYGKTNRQSIICDIDDKGKQILVVIAKEEVSSSSKKVEASSSSAAPKSSSSKAQSSSSGADEPPPVID